MLQRRRSEVSVDDRARLSLDLDDPLAELTRIWDRRRQEDVFDSVREHDDGLFPDDTALFVPHVVHLIEDYPGHFTGHFATVVEHTPEDLCGHDEAGGSLIDGDIARHQADVLELLLQLSILLIAESFDWRGVNNALLCLETLGDGVLGDGCLTSGGVGRHKD